MEHGATDDRLIAASMWGASKEQKYEATYPKVRSLSIAPKCVIGRRVGFVLRQDLFDRNHPNNLRSDWPGPPAQPGQF